MRDEFSNDVESDDDLLDAPNDTESTRGRPGLRASILAGLTLGAVAMAVIGQEVSTVVSSPIHG
jgi:hypothetical protein